MRANSRFAGEVAWAVIGVPVTIVSVVVLVVLLPLGALLSPVFAGLLLFAGALVLARGLGSAHRRLARSLLGVSVPEPARPHVAPGLWNWIKGRVTDPVSWRALAFLLLRLPMSVAELAVTAALLLYGFGTLIYPLTWPFTAGRALPWFNIHTTHWIGSVPLALAGGLLLLLTPKTVHGMLEADRFLARKLLGPNPLSERVRTLERSRATAIEDATARLRTIERDLHDGAQAQLVTLAMKLGIARDELSVDQVDVGQVRNLVSAAHGNAKQALTELRDLARGIRPPALDAGLDVALSTLAARSAIEVKLRVDLPDRPSPAVETLLYFTAAELLTNAAKHGSAPARLELARSAGGLRLSVTDEGPGGARVRSGGGLAGLSERVGTVDGRLDVHSPAGGPTVVTAHVPMGG